LTCNSTLKIKELLEVVLVKHSILVAWVELLVLVLDSDWNWDLKFWLNIQTQIFEGCDQDMSFESARCEFGIKLCHSKRP
jgi:hypothetical protein